MDNQEQAQSQILGEEEIAPIFQDSNAPSEPTESTDSLTAQVQTPEQAYDEIRKERKLSVFKLIVYFLMIPLLVGLILNAPAFLKRVSYWWTTEYQIQEAPPEDSPLAFLPQEANTVQTDKDDIIYIPKINTNAPIIWDVSSKEMLIELRKGVTHYRGTAKPGEIGNVFLVGHSSGYFWEGEYARVFTLLDKLIIGDKIYLKHKGTEYGYQVSDIKVISPNQTEVLDPTDKPILRLMTCVPIGTNLKRLVVQAEQISPAIVAP